MNFTLPNKIKKIIQNNPFRSFVTGIVLFFSFFISYYIVFNQPLHISVKMSAPSEEIVKAYWGSSSDRSQAYQPIIIKPVESQKWQLNIDALGEKNSKSDGFEVVVLDIRTPQNQADWSKGIFSGGEWEFRADPSSPQGKVAIAHSNKLEFPVNPEQVQSLSLPIEGGDVVIKFFANTGSGKVKITANKQVKQLDLFSPQGVHKIVSFPAMTEGDKIVREYSLSIPDTFTGKLYFIPEGKGNISIKEVTVGDRIILGNPKNIYYIPFRLKSRLNLSIFTTLFIVVLLFYFFEKIRLFLTSTTKLLYIYLLSQRQYWREYAAYFSLSVIIPVAFLFSPSPPEDLKFCGTYITVIKDTAGFPLNCDSGGFTDLLIRPENIFAEGQIRQTRPLYILLGWIFSVIPSSILKILKVSYFLPETHIYLEHYLGYLFLNVFIVFVSLICYHKLMVSFKVNKYLIYSSSLFLVGNEIVKGFFWTPHQQMFIIFTPVIAIFLLRLRMNQKISKFSIFLVTFVLGFFPLAYGSLFLLFPSLVIIYLQNREVQYLSIMSLRKFIEVFLLAIFFVFPVLFWVSLVKVTTGSFYSHETGQYRQFIWILDALSFGLHHFLDIASHRLSSYLSLLTPEIKIAFIVNIILLIYLLIRYGKKPFFQFLSKIQYIYLNFIIFFIFFYFLGSYFERLYFNLFALNIFINIILLNEILFLLKKRDNKSMIIITSSLVFLVSTTYFFQILLQIGPYE